MKLSGFLKISEQKNLVFSREYEFSYAQSDTLNLLSKRAINFMSIASYYERINSGKY